MNDGFAIDHLFQCGIQGPPFLAVPRGAGDAPQGRAPIVLRKAKPVVQGKILAISLKS